MTFDEHVSAPRLAVLHAAGGPALGLGHLRRCATLAGALAARGGFTVVLLAEDEPAVDEDEDRTPLADGFLPAGVRLVTVADPDAALAARDRLVAGFPGPALLVTDLLGLDAADAAVARAQGFVRLVHVNDDLGRDLPAGPYDADLFFLSNAWDTPESSGLPFERVRAGAAWHPVDPGAARLRPDTPRPAIPARRVLLTLGGADPGWATETVLTGLARLGWPVEVTVVAGPAFGLQRTRALAGLVAGHGELVIAPPSSASVLAMAELVVTLGGLTTYEAMCLGRPAATVAWGPMTADVDRLTGTGVAADLGPPEEAAARLTTLAGDGPELGRLARAGWELVDGRGASRVAAELDRLTAVPAATAALQEVFR
jgi:spore coat polysaccharide biosynthesis predicted glycosyltransferase SpsG